MGKKEISIHAWRDIQILYMWVRLLGSRGSEFGQRKREVMWE